MDRSTLRRVMAAPMRPLVRRLDHHFDRLEARLGEIERRVARDVGATVEYEATMRRTLERLVERLDALEAGLAERDRGGTPPRTR